MTLSLRQIRRRIRSIENTKKITRAMQMVSIAKLKRSENALYAARPYSLKMESILNRLLSSTKDTSNKYFQEKPVKEKFTLCLVTSDTGLCGTYNDNIIRVAENFVKRIEAEKLTLIPIGRKGYHYFRRLGMQIPHKYLGLHGRYSPELADEVAKILMDSFLSDKADEVYIAHTHFDSTMRYWPKLHKFLNMRLPESKQELEYILEPNLEGILNELIPKYLTIKMRLILLDAFTSEHSSRMVAMQMATNNAVELIESLTLLKNKARQAAITKEIIEVTTSAEALKG